MIIIKHHTIVSETSTHTIQNKEGHKINHQGSQIQSPSEICSGVHSDAWSSKSSNKSYLIWLPMQLPFLIDDQWCKYHHVHWSCWSHSLQLHLPLDCSEHDEQYWLDWKYWKNNKYNTMTMDMCLSIMKHNSFTFHYLIQWMQHQWNLLDLHLTLFSKRNSKRS